ncbi:MAG TPA: Na+/H+ antiporter [Actinomycetes bacterium]|jgi:CPA1 family monovalent cation:H+ antiporter|nr:Na+/H+ antiporter [Actinomycetes bacterium]
MEAVEVVFGLFVVLAAIATLAQRIEIPYPILLVIGGLVIGLIPGLPRVEIDPDLVLLIFLPPLLYSASLAMPPRELRQNLQPIALLALGLVLLTMVAVAVVAHTSIRGLSWAAGFTLGAIVSPPDPVAAVAIAHRLGLPRRLVTILEGEGLFNDATALVAYRLAAGAAVSGAFSVLEVGVRFVLAAVGAVIIGLAVGWTAKMVLRRLVDPPVENTVHLLVPFAAYVPAERLGASGILATLTTGLFMSRFGRGALTSAGRVQGQGLWDILVFILEGISFILIGLELRVALEGLAGRPVASLLGEATLICMVVIVVRIVWVFSSSAIRHRFRLWRGAPDPTSGWRPQAVVAWAGMRGVVSMAAALALPFTTDTGPFPQRDLLIFLSFSVILVTLVGQGLTLPALIRRLNVVEPAERAEHEEAKARLRLARVALERLDELERELDLPEERLEMLRRRYEHQIDRFTGLGDGSEDGDDELLRQRLRTVRQELVHAERSELQRIRNEHGLSPAVYRRVSQDLDVEELRLDR